MKEDNTRYKRRVEQRYGKPQKEESNRNPGNKKSLSQTKNLVEGHCSQLQQWKTECQSLKRKWMLNQKQEHS
jgi:hypothetical protein